MLLINGRVCSCTFIIGLHTKFHMFTFKASTVNWYQIESQKTFCILQIHFLSKRPFQPSLPPLPCGVTATIVFVAEITPTQHNKYKRRTSMPLAGFESAIPGIEWPLGLASICIYHTPFVDPEVMLPPGYYARLS